MDLHGVAEDEALRYSQEACYGQEQNPGRNRWGCYRNTGKSRQRQEASMMDTRRLAAAEKVQLKVGYLRLPTARR